MTAFGKKKTAPEHGSDADVEAPSQAPSHERGATGDDGGEPDLAAALADAEERVLRAQADYQNLRRRTQADIETAVARAKSEILGEAVTVLDYLDMALAAPVESDDAKNLKIGIEMTRGQLQALFDRLAVRPIEAVGTFDPSIHQAVSTVAASDAVAPGSIVEVVRQGWMMGDTVLRFAQVRVAAAVEPPAGRSGEAGHGDAPSNESTGTAPDNAEDN